MQSKRQYNLQELANLTDSKLIGDPDYLIAGIADLETANADEASFLANARYKHVLQKSKAGVIFIDPETPRLDDRNYLVSNHPSRSFQRFVDILYPPHASPSGFNGIHPTAVIHPTVQLSEDVTVGPYAVIDEEVIIGKSTFIGAGVYIGPKTVIGSSCLIYPNVVIREETKIGDRVTIQPGAIIGSCGFGYTTDEKGRHIKLNQVGVVVIEDDVEIGANTTIDRARFKKTIIGRGTKLDNLVQIGHGATLGPHNIFVAQSSIAGSSSTENHVVVAGQSGIAGHLHLGPQVTIAAKSGVSKSLPSGKYGGVPTMPLEEYNRNQVYLRNIKKYIDKIDELTKRIDQLESKKM